MPERVKSVFCSTKSGQSNHKQTGYFPRDETLPCSFPDHRTHPPDRLSAWGCSTSCIVMFPPVSRTHTSARAVQNEAEGFELGGSR